MRRTTAESFWARVEIGSDDECWPWLGYVDEGYGSLGFFSITGKRAPIRAHRVAWALAKGGGKLAPKGMHVHHTCENKLCVNPAHLEAITHREHRLLHNEKQRQLQRGCRIHGIEHWTRWSYCKECKSEYQRQWGARRKAAGIKKARGRKNPPVTPRVPSACFLWASSGIAG